LLLPLVLVAEMPGTGSARFQQKGEPIVTEGVFISTKILNFKFKSAILMDYVLYLILPAKYFSVIICSNIQRRGAEDAENAEFQRFGFIPVTYYNSSIPFYPSSELIFTYLRIAPKAWLNNHPSLISAHSASLR
jgi:hypothetical protein